jgi:hypothetical protein
METYMNLKLNILLLTLFVSGSWAATQTWKNFNDFSKGYFENVLLTHSGELQVGYPIKTLTQDLPSAVTAMTLGQSQEFYVATSGPGQVWQVKLGQKPALIFESEQPLITQLVSMPNGDLAILTGPRGGVTFIRPNTPKIKRFVSIPEQPMGAYLDKNKLLVVGSSNSFFAIQKYVLKKIPITNLENQFRSVYKNYVGSAQSGTVYQDKKAVFKAAGETVAMTGDKTGNLYAAFNTSPHASKIWKISRKEPSCLIWESSKSLIYSLVLHQSKLYWGTGPHGQLFASTPECKAKPDILLSLKDHERIMTLAPKDSKLMIATAQLGSLFELDLSKKTSSGRFITPVVKLDAPANITETSVPLWLGNTPIPDSSWTLFEKDKDRQAQFVEARVTILAGKPVSEISFSYNKPD